MVSSCWCSLLKSLNALGVEIAIFNACEFLLLYVALNPGSLMNSSSGIAFCKNDNAPPSAAIITLLPWFTRDLMIGRHRVACPNPQFNGLTNILFPKILFLQIYIYFLWCSCLCSCCWKIFSTCFLMAFYVCNFACFLNIFLHFDF